MDTSLQFPMRPLQDPDTESLVSSLKDGLDDEIGIESKKITSLYLQRQEDEEDVRKYKAYLQQPETLRATRRRQLFKQKEAYEEGKQKLDVTNYKIRKCAMAIPKKGKPDKCGCGRDIENPVHTAFNMDEAGHGTWTFKEHTVLEDTNAYGKVAFSSNQKAKYLRLDTDTPAHKISDLMNNVYNLSTPGVIISVIGSMVGFTCTNKIEKIIQRGMIKAAITTNGWITTSGFDCGHIKSVGEALETHNNAAPCIGFASWGCLPEQVKAALIVDESKKKKHGENQCKYPKSVIVPGSAVENLESNHSHFILSDTGAVSDWGSETYLRTRWEAHMRDEMSIPVVMITLQGGLGVCRTLYQGLKQGIPAVIVYGSGGLCDLLVESIRHEDTLSTRLGERKMHKFNLKKQKSRRKSVASNQELECTCTDKGINFDCQVMQQIMTHAQVTLEARNNPSFRSRVLEIISEYKDLLILYDMDNDHYDGLDTALLEALVKAQNVRPQEGEVTRKVDNTLSGVQVALGWNRPDFAEKLLNADTSENDEKAMGSLLIHALAWNLGEFTELLLSHGASIPMVAANTVVLYNSSYNIDHLKRFVRYNLGVSKGEIVFDKTTIDKMINKLAGERNKFHSNVSLEQDPYFELMLWAAVSLYPDIAEMMWKETQEPIRAALFVVMVLRRLSKSKKVIINANQHELVETMMVRFETLAISVLNNMHENCDSILRDRAINSCWERLNDRTYMDMAFQAQAQHFIAHPACQEITDRRWKRGLTSEVTLPTTVLVTLCPLVLLTPLVTFRSDHLGKRGHNFLFKFWKMIQAFGISPSVKFWMGVEMYLIFVIFQVWVILTKLDYCRHPITTPEILLYVWFGLLILDEVIQIVDSGKIWEWWSSTWNKVDCAMYLFNIIGLVLVHIPCTGDQCQSDQCEGAVYREECYNAGRIILSISSILFIHRLLHMFTSDAALGPTLLMIQNMIKDFKIFLFLFMIIATAFGVGYAVVLTNPTDLNNPEYKKTILAGMGFYPFFQMFGELYVDDLGSANETVWFPGTRSQTRAGFVVILAGIYLSIVVLMLVNILIAMFSDTYTRVKDQEDVIFKFQRLDLLMEMEQSFLPPPFSFIHFALSRVIQHKEKKKYKDNAESLDAENKWFDTVIRSAVVDCLEDHLKKERAERGTETEALMKENTKTLKGKIYKLQRYIENLQFTVDSNYEEMKVSMKNLNNRIQEESSDESS